MKKGDLVWMPSDITILQFYDLDGKDETVERFKRVQEPRNVLLVEKGEVYHKVFHDGETWSVLKADIYEAGY